MRNVRRIQGYQLGEAAPKNVEIRQGRGGRKPLLPVLATGDALLPCVRLLLLPGAQKVPLRPRLRLVRAAGALKEPRAGRGVARARREPRRILALRRAPRDARRLRQRERRRRLSRLPRNAVAAGEGEAVLLLLLDVRLRRVREAAATRGVSGRRVLSPLPERRAVRRRVAARAVAEERRARRRAQAASSSKFPLAKPSRARRRRRSRASARRITPAATASARTRPPPRSSTRPPATTPRPS